MEVLGPVFNPKHQALRVKDQCQDQCWNLSWDIWFHLWKTSLRIHDSRFSVKFFWGFRGVRIPNNVCDSPTSYYSSSLEYLPTTYLTEWSLYCEHLQVFTVQHCIVVVVSVVRVIFYLKNQILPASLKQEEKCLSLPDTKNKLISMGLIPLWI